MRKLKILVASLSLLIISTSGFNNAQYGVQAGQTAPIAELAKVTGNATGITSNKSLLINFWSATDAASRARAKSYQTKIDLEKTQLISINLSDNPSLYKAIVSSDGMNAETSIRVDAEASEKLRKAFCLGDNYGAILVSANGTVTAVNPAAETL